MRRLLSEQPDQPVVLARLARLLHRLRRVEEAIPLMQRAAQVAPSAAAFNDLGSLHIAAGDLPAAIEAYRTAIRLDPRYALGHINLGDALVETGGIQEATAAYRTVLSIDPASIDGRIGLAVALLRVGDAATAVEECRRALAVDSSGVQPWHVLAIALGMSGDNQAAIAAEREALARNPQFAKGWHALGNLLDESGDIEQAADAYRHALELDPALVEASYDLAALSAAPAPPQMPRSYVTRLFDDFAATFERRLVDELAYRVPEALRAAVARHWPTPPPTGLDVLDLGCGTGLVGKQFRDVAGHLTGIDLSTGMLAEAGRSGLYDRLICEDVVQYMRTADEAFDLILAADLFIYIGDLSELFAAVSAALRAGALLAFSIETQHEPFVLRRSRRYAHSVDYIRELGRAQSPDPAGIESRRFTSRRSRTGRGPRDCTQADTELSARRSRS